MLDCFLWIFPKLHGYHVLQWGLQIYLRITFSLNHTLAFWSTSFLNSAWRPQYQKYINQVILSCTTLENIVLPIFGVFFFGQHSEIFFSCKYFFSSSCSNVLILFERNFEGRKRPPEVFFKNTHFEEHLRATASRRPNSLYHFLFLDLISFISKRLLLVCMV